MDIQILRDLGLTQTEAKIYLAMIRYGGSTVPTLSTRTGVHRRNAYDAMHRLIEKGLAYEIFEDRETIYEPVDPTKLMEFVDDKQKRLTEALPAMLKEYTRNTTSQRAYIYRGVEGVKNYLREILSVGEDFYSLGGKGFWFDPRLKTFTNWFLIEAKRKKIKINIIYDKDAYIASDFERLGYQCKALPGSAYTNSTIGIFGDHVATFTGLEYGSFRDDVTIFTMVSQELADSYRIWWKMIQDLLPEPPIVNKLSSLKTRKTKPTRKKKTR